MRSFNVIQPALKRLTLSKIKTNTFLVRRNYARFSTGFHCNNNSYQFAGLTSERNKKQNTAWVANRAFSSDPSLDNTFTVPEHARVVICGGGVNGLSIAYHLSQRGWSDVVVLEQGK